MEGSTVGWLDGADEVLGRWLSCRVGLLDVEG